jgi:hypothetical protein
VLDAEKHSITFHPILGLSLIIAALLVRRYLKGMRKVENEKLQNELARYLHISRIQSVIKPEEQAQINRITENWNNASYKWPMPPINTLKP